MALNTNPFVEGIDPSATFGGYASVLLQLIRQAQPSSTYGMILFDTTAPDVTGANAWRKRCIWIDLTVPGTPTVNVYKEGGSPGWANVQSVIPNNTITTAMIQNAAVTLAKLSVSGGTANQLIRVNGTGTAFEFVSLASLVTAGSIPVGSLITTGIPAGQLRFAGVVGPNVATWYDAQQIINALANASIGSDLIGPAPITSARSKMLTTRTADTFATWRYFEPNVDILNDTMNGSKLQANTVGPERIVSTGIPDGYLLSKVAGVPDWIPAPTANYVNKYTSTATALPAAGSAVTPLTHGLGGQPLMIRGVLVCVTTDLNYVAGDEVDIQAAFTSSGNNEFPVFNLYSTATQIKCVRSSHAGLKLNNATTGTDTAITEANWNIKFYAIK
jgi:hypothetical protein